MAGGSAVDGGGATTAEARGQALYAATGVDCIQCHNRPETLRRDAVDATMLANRIAAAIAMNTGRMGDPQYGYAALTRAQLMDLAAYLVSLAPVAPVPDAGPSGDGGTGSTVVQCTSTGSSSFRTEVVATGLTSPWGMAFLPDQRILVTQKPGTMVLLSADAGTRTTLSWSVPAPDIISAGQGGLLDVALDPAFATNPLVYFTYSEPGPNGSSGAAVGRARLQGTSLVDFQRVFQQTPKLSFSEIHFGSRLAFRSDGTLFASFGDRSYDDASRATMGFAQNVANTVGKIIRIFPDGGIPPNNPFRNQAGAAPEVWSLGHRNPQGLTFDGPTSTLWSTEHGPQGGDELNVILPRANYAWPLRSYGCPYGTNPPSNTCRYGGGAHLPVNGLTFTEPVTFWAPTSIAPSNVLVYRGAGFPNWNGHLFVGGLGGRLWRIELTPAGAFASCEALVLNERIRDVRQGPDGWIWVLTDSGSIRRLVL
ncbi:MAG: PQQ-dependent sugar dehydrogenase [Myxococcaceae bacterium]|jgi:glucose/arabinose dehydrogenase|nr:PQQ-dependent sugar dehydrogenase [Myxococcaceae bacterium]